MRRLLWPAWVAGLILAVAASVGIGGWLMVSKSRSAGVADGPLQRSAVLDVARAGIPKIFAYDYRTVEQQLTAATDLMTPAYRAEFTKNSPQIVTEAKRRQTVVQADIVGAAVESLDVGSGQLLVFMNRTVVDGPQAPVYEGSRLRVIMQFTDDKWLIAHITPV